MCDSVDITSNITISQFYMLLELKIQIITKLLSGYQLKILSSLFIFILAFFFFLTYQLYHSKP